MGKRTSAPLCSLAHDANSSAAPAPTARKSDVGGSAPPLPLSGGDHKVPPTGKRPLRRRRRPFVEPGSPRPPGSGQWRPEKSATFAGPSSNSERPTCRPAPSRTSNQRGVVDVEASIIRRIDAQLARRCRGAPMLRNSGFVGTRRARWQSRTRREAASCAVAATMEEGTRRAKKSTRHFAIARALLPDGTGGGGARAVAGDRQTSPRAEQRAAAHPQSRRRTPHGERFRGGSTRELAHHHVPCPSCCASACGSDTMSGSRSAGRGRAVGRSRAVARPRRAPPIVMAASSSSAWTARTRGTDGGPRHPRPSARSAGVYSCGSAHAIRTPAPARDVRRAEARGRRPRRRSSTRRPAAPTPKESPRRRVSHRRRAPHATRAARRASTTGSRRRPARTRGRHRARQGAERRCELRAQRPPHMLVVPGARRARARGLGVGEQVARGERRRGEDPSGKRPSATRRRRRRQPPPPREPMRAARRASSARRPTAAWAYGGYPPLPPCGSGGAP